MKKRGLGRKAKGTTCYEKDTVVKSLVFGALVVYILVWRQFLGLRSLTRKDTAMQLDAGVYSHGNLDLPPEEVCTEDQRNTIYRQLGLNKSTVNVGGCQSTDWLISFFEEEEDIGTESFLSISIGCNKGTDAIHTTRLGLLDPKFDVPAWMKAIGGIEGVCPDHERGRINFAKRQGEVHCVEPTRNNFQLVKNASELLSLDSKQFVVVQAAVSSRNGNAKFPDMVVGVENGALDWCDQMSSQDGCHDVKMYSLDSYVDKFVESKGPINVLSIDTEGRDFDVLFGASSTLDRTYYLEFEYHIDGDYPLLFCFDVSLQSLSRNSSIEIFYTTR